ncbi:uncharacterized protein LOC143424878 [Xylocopa sonorina]|uniref:uncharacterized protein LOC143424878 n=1 Tax=Xylocopa sonorina TaxID=1818115 RepID=UPI00403AA8FB
MLNLVQITVNYLYVSLKITCMIYLLKYFTLVYHSDLIHASITFYICKKNVKITWRVKYMKKYYNMEAITFDTSLNVSEPYNDSKNASGSSSLCVSPTANNILQSEDKNECTSLDLMSKYFDQLNIQSYSKHNEEKNEHLAGIISNIIDTLRIVLVKPHSPDILLYIGTPLFLISTKSEHNKSKYKLLGYIDDIFGSIGEPMYSVTMNCNLTDALDISEHVYYFPNHPSTLHMYVEHTTSKTSDIRKYNIKIDNL